MFKHNTIQNATFQLTADKQMQPIE